MGDNAEGKTESRQVSLTSAWMFKLKRSAPVVGQWMPEALKRRVHRARYRRRIGQAWAARGDISVRMPDAHRVDFMVAGTQKAGTSALMDLFSQHERVVVPVLKEPHFFDNDGFFGSDDIPVPEYHDAFPWEGKDKLYGEGTPRNMFARRCVERIHRYNPDMRLICILRDPVERAFSAWNMNHGMVEERDFATLVEWERHAVAEHGPLQRGFVNYLSRGMYAHQVRHLRKHFPKEQLCFIRYREFREDNEAVFKTVCRFLGLPADVPGIQLKQSNVYRYDSALDLETEGALRAWFRPEVEDLEGLLGWDLSDWK